MADCEVSTAVRAQGVQEAAALQYDNSDDDHELCIAQKMTLNAHRVNRMK